MGLRQPRRSSLRQSAAHSPFSVLIEEPESGVGKEPLSSQTHVARSLWEHAVPGEGPSFRSTGWRRLAERLGHPIAAWLGKPRPRGCPP